MDAQLSKIERPLPLIPHAQGHGFERTGRTQRVAADAEHARLLGQVLGVVIVLVGRRALSAAEPAAVRAPPPWAA